MNKSGRCIAVLACLVPALSPAATQAPSLKELWVIVQQQQATIDRLEKVLSLTRTQLTAVEANLDETKDQVAASDEKIEATADAIELGATGGSSWADQTTIGGYGELHYNNWDDNTTDHDGASDDHDRVDYHRFVLYVGHEFTDSIRFFSEIELEHSLAGDGKPGEVELEQAWLEMDINQQHRFRSGLDILPIGIINQTHEPNTFFGVERNRVETEIIPATWWEAVAGFNGEIAPGWNYDVYAHSGLTIPTTGGSAFRPRSGRTKIAEADDVDVATTGRLRYTGYPGLEIGVSGQYQADYTGTADDADVGAFLFETHLDYRHASGAGLRALYAGWNFDDDPSAGVDPDAANADHLDGFYVEPSLRRAVPQWLPDFLPGHWGVFYRYSEWDQSNQLPGADYRFARLERHDVGLNYWPHPNVVFKVDGHWEEADAPVDRTADGFNLGMGYQF